MLRPTMARRRRRGAQMWHAGAAAIATRVPPGFQPPKKHQDPPRVKPLLYVYRVLLTGIHLMRTGRIEANLITLNEDFRLPYIGELVSRRIYGEENPGWKLPRLSFIKGNINV